MDAFFQEFFRKNAVTGIGGALVIIGVMFWTYRRTFKQAIAIRQAYALRLRANGEVDKASRIETETAEMMRRGPIYGYILTFAGAAVIIAGIIWGK